MLAPEILYRDRWILVCRKPAGWLSEPGKGKSLPVEIARQLEQAGEDSTVLTVHRLDKPVGGLMVLARTSDAAARLIAQIAAHETEKEYLAVVRGVPAEEAGTWEDLLFHDSRTNKTFVVSRRRKGVRPASLSYQVLQTVSREGQTLALLRIRLHTGRTHQIRVQFSHRGMPLLGDIRYGSKADHDPALFSCRLAFRHPQTGERMEFTQFPTGEPWNLFRLPEH